MNNNLKTHHQTFILMRKNLNKISDGWLEKNSEKLVWSPDKVISLSMFGAYVIEIGLKLLIRLELQEKVTGHNLMVLFRQLSSKTQSSIIQNIIKDYHGHNQKQDVTHLIQKCSDNFVNLRYLYEIIEKGESIEDLLIPGFIESFLNSIEKEITQ